MRARSREVHTDLTLLPHKTRVRHKKQAQVPTISKTSKQRPGPLKSLGGSRRSMRSRKISGGCRWGSGGSRASRRGAGGPGSRSSEALTSHKTRKIRQTSRRFLSSLLRSCIQDCVQEVPVGQMAQGTPPRRTPRPSQVASTGFINFSIFFTKCQVSLFKIIFCHELFIIFYYRAPSPASLPWTPS